MRRSIFRSTITSMAIFFSVGLFAQKSTASLGLVGKVKSLHSVTRPLANPSITEPSGFLDSERFDSIALTFDAYRHLILEENFLDYRGKLGIFDRTVYWYNPQHKIEKLETTLIQNGEEPRKISQRKIFYYINKRLVRMDEFNSGRTTDQHWVVNSVYENDRLQEKVFWMDDAVFSRTRYSFDENHNILSEKTVHNNGQQGLSIIYENKSNGLPQRIIDQSGDHHIVETIEYSGNYPSKVTVSDANAKVLRTTYYHPNGRIFEIHLLNYSTNGTDIYRFEYEFDSNNNWVKCKITKNQTPAYIISRKINYYN